MSSENTSVGAELEQQPGFVNNNVILGALMERQSSVASFDKSESPTSYQARIEESISKTFPSFAQTEILVAPYDRETRKDSEFIDQLQEMILDLILEIYAWSISRPEHESTLTGDALYEETQKLQAIEREQEASRLRLLEFVTRIKSALAALTGVIV